ncbi:MAG: hypothetical protein AAF633_21005 [Chloroflexota bacterium]
MNRNRAILFTLSLVLSLVVFLAGCQSGSGSYEATFDNAADWATGETDNLRGEVVNGVYDLLVYSDIGLYWVTPDQTFGDGTYSVEATPIEGPIDNGYGMVFQLDEDDVSFYLFEVSGDGFVWIGRCEGNCQEDMDMLVDTSWFPSDSVKTGLDVTNTLKVTVDGGDMVFFVNGEEVGRAFDDALGAGNIGLAVETIGQGGVRVQFDNFNYVPN